MMHACSFWLKWPTFTQCAPLSVWDKFILFLLYAYQWDNIAVSLLTALANIGLRIVALVCEYRIVRPWSIRLEEETTESTMLVTDLDSLLWTLTYVFNYLCMYAQVSDHCIICSVIEQVLSKPSLSYDATSFDRVVRLGYLFDTCNRCCRLRRKTTHNHSIMYMTIFYWLFIHTNHWCVVTHVKCCRGRCNWPPPPHINCMFVMCVCLFVV